MEPVTDPVMIPSTKGDYLEMNSLSGGRKQSIGSDTVLSC